MSASDQYPLANIADGNIHTFTLVQGTQVTIACKFYESYPVTTLRILSRSDGVNGALFTDNRNKRSFSTVNKGNNLIGIKSTIGNAVKFWKSNELIITEVEVFTRQAISLTGYYFIFSKEGFETIAKLTPKLILDITLFSLHSSIVRIIMKDIVFLVPTSKPVAPYKSML